MLSPEEFMQNYFRAPTDLYREEIERRKPYRRSFFSDTCVYDSRNKAIEQSETEHILSVSAVDGGAEVITTGIHYVRNPFRVRYRLKTVRDAWRIDRVDIECPLCQGGGKKGNNDCPVCKGKGWCNE